MKLLAWRWIVAHIVIAALALTMVSLGVWQLRRLDERRAANIRMARVATFTGTWDGQRQWLVSGKALGNRPGFHVVTPLVLADDTAVLVSRGWVPLTQGQAPEPPSGVATVRGTLYRSEPRAPFTPSRVKTGDRTVRRIDIDALQRSYDKPLAAEWLVLRAPATEGVTVTPARRPSNGPHQAYAVQWFVFATVLLVGYGFVARKRLRAPSEA